MGHLITRPRKDELEALLESGLKPTDIARQRGVSRQRVHQWLNLEGVQYIVQRKYQRRPRAEKMSDWDRFIEKVVIPDNPDECWRWLGGRSSNGYGSFTFNGICSTSHRFSYVHHHGPIPEGLVIDHLCNNTNCVNPNHLKAVTGTENTHRHFAAITHCKRGHPLSGDNVYRHPTGRRVCKACEKFRLGKKV